MSILIVDDSLDIRILIETYLKSSGYTDIVSVKSAREAFEYLGIDNHKNQTDNVVDASQSKIDLIILDIMMPEINGIDTCYTIKKFEHLKDIPIIIVSAISEVDTLQSAFSCGAVDYITKPLRKVELLARVNSALKLKFEMDARKANEIRLLELTRQLEEKNQILERLSSIDGLTGIANRRYFDDYLEKEWKRLRRESQTLSLIMVDIDFFKNYNDTYGHTRGDDCLRKVADVLNKILKRPADLLARYGGEEFSAILPNTHIDGAKKLAEEMRHKVEEMGIVHTASLISDRVTISLGVASMIPTGDLKPEHLISKADKALYEAKQTGRNKVVSG